MGLSSSHIVEKKNIFKNTLKFGLTIGFLLKKKKKKRISKRRRRRRRRRRKKNPRRHKLGDENLSSMPFD